MMATGSRKKFKKLIVSNIKHEILGSLSSVRDDGLQRVDEATNVFNNEITDTLDSVGGGGKVEDCLLQVSTADCGGILWRLLLFISGHLLSDTGRGGN